MGQLQPPTSGSPAPFTGWFCNAFLPRREKVPAASCRQVGSRADRTGAVRRAAHRAARRVAAGPACIHTIGGQRITDLRARDRSRAVVRQRDDIGGIPTGDIGLRGVVLFNGKIGFARGVAVELELSMKSPVLPGPLSTN